MKKLFSFLFIFFIVTGAQAQDVIRYAGIASSSGSTDGSASVAKFNHPHGICVDKTGNVFVADQLNNKIRKITPAPVNVSTFAGSGANGSNDGTGTAATF